MLVSLAWLRLPIQLEAKTTRDRAEKPWRVSTCTLADL
jgi:hypothetical protein